MLTLGQISSPNKVLNDNGPRVVWVQGRHRLNLAAITIIIAARAVQHDSAARNEFAKLRGQIVVYR
jgi:hypothetical protein